MFSIGVTVAGLNICSKSGTRTIPPPETSSANYERADSNHAKQVEPAPYIQLKAKSKPIEHTLLNN